MSGGRCLVLSADPNNCGSVGNQCRDSEACISGTCVCRPPTQRLPGSQQCVDTRSDANNCGTIGTVCGGAMPVCVNGNCQPGNACMQPSQLCGGRDCVNVRTDPANCGQCGNVCARDEVCVQGRCRAYEALFDCALCQGGWTCCTYPLSTSTQVCVDSGNCPVL